MNANKDGITGTAAREEDWSLDATGNWSGFLQKTSGTTALDQDRDQNERGRKTGQVRYWKDGQ